MGQTRAGEWSTLLCPNESPAADQWPSAIKRARSSPVLLDPLWTPSGPPLDHLWRLSSTVSD
eukprot:872624-Prorocentrum_minimum.AAC.4